VSRNDHDHRSEYAEARHDHDLDYAEKHHRHYDLERADERAQQEIRELRAELGAALDRIADLEKQTPQARQLQYEADLAAADLAESGYRHDNYGPPVGADRHGSGCQCPYCYDEPEDDQAGVPEPQTGVAAMQRFMREHPLGAPRQASRVYWPDARCEFVDRGMCGERAVARVTSRAEPSEHLWCCGRHRDHMLRVSPDDAYVSWAKPAALTCLHCGTAATGRPGDRCPECSRQMQLASGDEPEQETPVEEYDPGPEVDDEGGMSEYRYLLSEDYQRGQS
jgi:hypothetical protein